MAKINLDKYYTPIEVALQCIAKVKQLLPEITEFLEPSAGNGSFSLQLPEGSLAFDIAPEHDSIKQCDFLELELPYKQCRCVIGNPPFGDRNALSVKFYKKSVQLGDYIAFILPASQVDNNQQMYEFDLIHSELLDVTDFSGVKLLCAFNIYKRPSNGLNLKPINYKLKDVLVTEYRRGGSYEKLEKYDFGICSWGNIGKKVDFVGQYAQENYVIVNNLQYRDRILEILENTDWNSLASCIATKKLQSWRIYKHLKDCIPELE
jgi:hypothetical protein